MRHSLLGAAALATALLAAYPVDAQEKKTYARENAVVMVARKATPSIVMIRVPQKGADDRVGTGVIFDERGLIVTNAHVVKGATSVKVRLHGDITVRGEVLCRDARIDLAVVRVAVEQTLTPIPFGTAKKLKIGERVVAIGHPFGYANSVSTGIVSALGRSIDIGDDDWISGIVQTDAKINPGNSGGPLLNLNGELVALNVAIRDSAQGIAFAINVDMVKTFLDRQVRANAVRPASTSSSVTGPR